MNDADSTLSILIKLGMDPAGAHQAVDEINKLKKSQQDADEEGKKGQEKLFESHRENREILHSLTDQAIPGMGRALSAIAMGPTGAIVALVLLVEKLQDNIEKTTQKLYELAQGSANAFGGGSWLNDYVKAVSDAVQQTQDLEAALRKAKQAADDIENKREENSIKTLVKALHGGEDVESAALTAARKAELKQREGGQGALEEAARSKETPASVLLTRGERASELKAQQSALDKATADLNSAENDDVKDKIERKKREITMLPAVGPMAGLLPGLQNELDQLEGELAESRKAVAERRVKELSAQVLEDEKNAAEEKSVFDEAKEKATSNAKRVTELKNQIQEAQDAAAIKSETAAKQILSLLPLLDAKTAEKVAGINTPEGASNLVKQFLDAQGRLSSRHGTGGDQDMVRLMNAMLEQTRNSDAKMFQVLEQLISHKGNVDAQLRELFYKMGYIDSRTNHPTQ
ncbi:MAG TPA: hypothetical protein VKV04_07435 [Verrucomicrobiae bacterium]|nr:hypothetical protein [Verrucomicrobiae bacterium]